MCLLAREKLQLELACEVTERERAKRWPDGRHTTGAVKFRQAGSLPKYHCSTSSWVLDMSLTCQATSVGYSLIVDRQQGSRRPLMS